MTTVKYTCIITRDPHPSYFVLSVTIFQLTLNRMHQLSSHSLTLDTHHNHPLTPHSAIHHIQLHDTVKVNGTLHIFHCC